MKIEHLAIWANDLDGLKDFYLKYFGATANEKYHNPQKNFQSYFLSFESGARLELMQLPTINERTTSELLGLAHLAFAVGSEAVVLVLTERLRADGYQVVSEPRRTGDGYFESCVLDPEQNRIEITV